MARTTITTIEAENALVGAWCKRVVPFHCQMSIAPPTDDGGTSSTLRYDFRFRWVSGPGELYAWVGMWVTANAGQSTPPEVVAEIYNGAGVLVDAGVTWTTADGSLPTAPLDAAFPARGVLVGGERWIETGWADATEVAGGPRLLALGPPGTLQELRISPIGTRINGGLIVARNNGRLPVPT